jgi:hypothetical protein
MEFAGFRWPMAQIALFHRADHNADGLFYGALGSCTTQKYRGNRVGQALAVTLDQIFGRLPLRLPLASGLRGLPDLE